MSQSRKPKLEFFVIGAARSGTTSLYRALAQHPDIYQSPVKEPRFFAQNWSKGWDWFASLYEGARPEQLCGDFSPSYSNAYGINSAAERIARHYPQARIVYMLRNPIECAISNWRMTAEIRGEEISFRAALDHPDWKAMIHHRTLFFRQLEHFRAHFPDAQILVVPLELARREGPLWLNRVQRHIGLREERILDLSFPFANRSDLKPKRPPTPEIPMADRRYYLDLVSRDTRLLLEHLRLPREIWNIHPESPAWSKGRTSPAG